jgi:hypothetical protein
MIPLVGERERLIDQHLWTSVARPTFAYAARGKQYIVAPMGAMFGCPCTR